MSKFALFLIVLAILITLGVVFYLIQPLKKLSLKHDAKRKEDLMKIAAALEKYHGDYGMYPKYDEAAYIIVTSSYEVPWGTPFNPYLDVLPKDTSPRRYVYWSDKESNYQSFRVYASLEDPQDEKNACGTLKADCPNVPAPFLCGSNLPCNYGVSSGNISP